MSRYYAFFCLVTALSYIVLNMYYVWIFKPGFGKTGTLIYLLVTGLSTFIFAPVFFIVLIFCQNLFEIVESDHTIVYIVVSAWLSHK